MYPAMMTAPTAARAKHVWTDPSQAANQRSAERKPVRVPGRLTWKDNRGATRFATVVTRNVSEFGVFVECQSPVSIPLYRLVQFQLEQNVRDVDSLPASLRQGRLLSAVYRVSPPSTPGAPHGFALRLMVDPKRMAAASPIRATA
jgi:hypothetical protein